MFLNKIYDAKIKVPTVIKKTPAVQRNLNQQDTGMSRGSNESSRQSKSTPKNYRNKKMYFFHTI